MVRLEIIHLRSHSRRERNDAIAAFDQLSIPKAINRLMEMWLFRDHALESDLKIFIRWHGITQHTGKSPLGLQLAAAFAEFGQIRHTTWDLVSARITHAAI